MNSIRKTYYKFKLYSFLHKNSKVIEIQEEGKRCFVFLAADYGNLGDVAITYAQEKFLKNNLPDYSIIDVPISKTLIALQQIKKIIKKDDIITVVGGGNMGDLYYDIELLRLMVIDVFKNNRIILFPQTIIYSDKRKSKFLVNLSKRIYERHPNLKMSAREKISYKEMKELYPVTNLELTPDIVMSLDERYNLKRKDSIIFCIRDDKEKKNNTDILISIESYCKKNNLKIEKYDTHIGRNNLTLEERTEELHKIWGCFRKSRLVVTDRLHGMIFAYITGTPALVLPNNNFKIEGCYNWIKECGFIEYCKGIENLNSMISNLLDNDKNLRKVNLESDFQKLLG